MGTTAEHRQSRLFCLWSSVRGCRGSRQTTEPAAGRLAGWNASENVVCVRSTVRRGGVVCCLAPLAGGHRKHRRRLGRPLLGQARKKKEEKHEAGTQGGVEKKKRERREEHSRNKEGGRRTQNPRERAEASRRNGDGRTHAQLPSPVDDGIVFDVSREGEVTRAGGGRQEAAAWRAEISTLLLLLSAGLRRLPTARAGWRPPHRSSATSAARDRVIGDRSRGRQWRRRLSERLLGCCAQPLLVPPIAAVVCIRE